MPPESENPRHGIKILTRITGSPEKYINANIKRAGLDNLAFDSLFTGFRRGLLSSIGPLERQRVELTEYFYQRVQEVTNFDILNDEFDSIFLEQLATNTTTAWNLKDRLNKYAGILPSNYDVYMYYLEFKEKRSQIPDAMFALLETYLMKIGALK